MNEVLLEWMVSSSVPLEKQHKHKPVEEPAILVGQRWPSVAMTVREDTTSSEKHVWTGRCCYADTSILRYLPQRTVWYPHTPDRGPTHATTWVTSFHLER